MELYGEEGTIDVPDPNFFGGDVRVTKGARPVIRLPKWEHPFGISNRKHPRGPVANYRAAGLADMANAILKNRPHRCSMEMALHAVDVMTSILKSGQTGRPVALRTTCDRPEPLTPAQARALLARKGK
jgi:predicted dehydrogenase